MVRRLLGLGKKAQQQQSILFPYPTEEGHANLAFPKSQTGNRRHVIPPQTEFPLTKAGKHDTTRKGQLEALPEINSQERYSHLPLGLKLPLSTKRLPIGQAELGRESIYSRWPGLGSLNVPAVPTLTSPAQQRGMGSWNRENRCSHSKRPGPGSLFGSVGPSFFLSARVTGLG